MGPVYRKTKKKSDNIKNLIVDTSNGRFFAEKIGEKYAETEILK